MTRAMGLAPDREETRSGPGAKPRRHGDARSAAGAQILQSMIAMDAAAGANGLSEADDEHHFFCNQGPHMGVCRYGSAGCPSLPPTGER